MKKFKTLVKDLKVRYYRFMYEHHIDALEAAQCEYGESHKKSLRLLKIATKYENKLNDITYE